MHDLEAAASTSKARHLVATQAASGIEGIDLDGGEIVARFNAMPHRAAANRERHNQVMRIFGLNLRRLRIEAGMTEHEVAALAGLADQTVWQIERGEPHDPGPGALHALSKAFGRRIADMISPI